MSTVGETLTPLGLPRPVAVRLDARGEPLEVRRSQRGPRPLGVSHAAPREARLGAPLAVKRLEEVWRIAEEWWREAPLRRTYCRVLVDGGRALTLFHDDTAPPEEGWFEQRY